MRRKHNPIGCLLVTVAVLAFWIGFALIVKYAVDNLRSAEKAHPESASVAVHRTASEELPISTEPVLQIYREGDGPAPEWYRPDEPMAVEWMANAQQSDTVDYNAPAIAHNPVGIASGGIDWNIETETVGWDGHRMAAWEMDLFARIVYLEFWGCSHECVNAGVDSILNLWDSGYFGHSIGDVLTARAEDGSLVYSPYAYVWSWDYDAQGLSEIRQICEDRFINGPEYGVSFFRLWYYHDWCMPCFEIDNVYFSDFYPEP